jgi:hypothetical protein
MSVRTTRGIAAIINAPVRRPGLRGALAQNDDALGCSPCGVAIC